MAVVLMDKHQEYLMSCPSVPKLPYCPVCGKAGPTTEHHIVPRGQGGHDGPTIYLCGHGTRGCHGDAEDKRLHFDYWEDDGYSGSDTGWYYASTEMPTKFDDLPDIDNAMWLPVVVKWEFDQTVPFDEPEPDEGDRVHEYVQKLTRAAETASTIDWVVGDILNSLAPLMDAQSLYDVVEEAFGVSHSTVASFISRRRKIATLDERYADLGMSKMLALLDAVDKTDYPIEHLEPEVRALSVSDFKVKFGLKKEPAPKHECPDCGAVHTCKHKEE